ncbi:MAG: hypothetical protein ACYDDF_00585 [Thermoplasmatota archaeon]
MSPKARRRKPSDGPAADRRIFVRALEESALPPFLVGEPSRMAASIAAARITPSLLGDLAELHHLKEWTPEAFEAVFVERGLQGWHGDIAVARRPGGFVVRTARCPLTSAWQADPRACQLCCAVREQAAREAYGPALDSVRFPKLISHGDSVCEMRITALDRPAAMVGTTDPSAAA